MARMYRLERKPFEKWIAFWGDLDEPMLGEDPKTKALFIPMWLNRADAEQWADSQPVKRPFYLKNFGTGEEAKNDAGISAVAGNRVCRYPDQHRRRLT